MSSDPPASSNKENEETSDAAGSEVGGIGLTGAISLGTSGGALGGKDTNGIQRPPMMDKASDSDLPKVTVPPFSSARAEPPAEMAEDEPLQEAEEEAAISEEEPAPIAADETTRPPSSTMRYSTPFELYAGFPEVKNLTLHRPREGDSVSDYMARLRGSTTPEEAVTFTAFAAQPAMAIWWAYGCLRTMADTLSPEDRGMMEMIAMWSGNPDNTNRWRVMKSALYAPKLTPVGYLGLAVGWSGGSVAPNDPAPVPSWRTPKAVNTAVLSSIAHISLQERSRSLARFIDLAGKMFEV
jgi:hypothetical protein